MSDPTRGNREYESQLGTIIEGPPSTGWVVHLVNSTKQGSQPVWAWCKVSVDGPGYSEIAFTQADGSTPGVPGDGPLQLGPVITKVWC